MKTTTKRKETSDSEDKSGAIDSYDEFNRAVLEIHADITSHHNPSLEVTEKLFKALTKGRDLDSFTWGNPGIRVFKVGTTDKVLKDEEVTAENYREREIKAASQAANR